MEIEAILKELERLGDHFPREALEAALAQQEAITPHLLKAVEDATRNIGRGMPDKAYVLLFYALYLLAQFREERAYPLIVELFSTHDEALFDANTTFITETLGRVLASVSGGDMRWIQPLIENPELNEYVRAAALWSLVCMVVNDLQSRDAVITYFRRLFQERLEREYSFAWDSLVSCALAIYPAELMPDIRQAFADGFVDTPGYIDLPYVEESLKASQEATLAKTRRDRHHHLIDDTISEMEGWFSIPLDAFPSETEPDYVPQPRLAPVHPQKKVGRNAPCACGSGKKYKHCCLRKGRV